MSSKLAPALHRKLRKVLETRTDSPDLLTSLNTLSSFYSENSLSARRNLRSTIEKRGLSINEQFLRASEAAQKVRQVLLVGEGSAYRVGYFWVAKALSTCSATTGDIVTATERLKLELETTPQRQEIISNFLHNYQLSPEEFGPSIAPLVLKDRDFS